MSRPVPSNKALEQYIGPPLREAFRHIMPGSDDSAVEDAVAAYRERFSTVGLLENRLYEGISCSLDSLAASGARLYVATSKPQCFAERILEHFDIAKHIQSVYGSELDGTRSDKRELISYVLKAERLEAADAIMVGDRKHDVIGALHNEVLPVGVLWGYGSAQELLAAGARDLLFHPHELAKDTLRAFRPIPS
jgi:phosphoglycolate phosphatase